MISVKLLWHLYGKYYFQIVTTRYDLYFSLWTGFIKEFILSKKKYPIGRPYKQRSNHCLVGKTSIKLLKELPSPMVVVTNKYNEMTIN